VFISLASVGFRKIVQVNQKSYDPCCRYVTVPSNQTHTNLLANLRSIRSRDIMTRFPTPPSLFCRGGWTPVGLPNADGDLVSGGF
jgi:hypothetical protein